MKAIVVVQVEMEEDIDEIVKVLEGSFNVVCTGTRRNRREPFIDGVHAFLTVTTKAGGDKD